MYCIPTAYRAVQTRDSRMDTAWELAGKETVFCLAQVPLTCTGVPDDILNPKNQWSNKGEFDKTLAHLADLYQVS